MNRNGVLFSLMLIIVCSCCFLGACSNEEKHEHNYKSFVYKEATCAEEGVMEKLCLECGDKKYETIEKNSAHNCDWIIVKQATCIEEGIKEGTCLECGTVLEESIVAKGDHTETDWKVIYSATCTQNGIKQKICKDCNAVLETEEISKTNHTAGDWQLIFNASCTQNGLKLKTCVDCNVLLEIEGIEKPSHNESDWVIIKQATCSQNGVKQKTCVNCSVVLEIEEIEKEDHLVKDWVITKQATCTEEGVKAGNCSGCGEELTQIIPKEEHEFEYGRCVKCFSMNIVANLLENEKLGYSIADVFETIEKYGYNVDSYYLDLFVRISAKNNTVECNYNYSGVDFSLSIENMVSDFAVDSQYNLLIDGISIHNEYVNIIYKDGSVIRAGAIDELVGENIIGYEGIIKSIAINNQNQLLVVYEDNSVVLYGVVSNEISSVVPGMLYMKNGDTYSCLGFLDKNNRQTEINVAPSHKGELVDSIAQGAFFENKNLEKVVLSNEIKTIEDYAFYYCSKLREVDLGNSLEKIGEDAFSYCAIEEITIPISCTVISRFAFYHCQNLSKIYYEGTIEQWQEIDIEKYWKLDTPTIQIICTNGTISVN